MPLIPPDAGLLAQYRVRCFLAELGGVQVVIIAVLGYQLAVRTLLGYFAAAYYQYPVRVADGGKPVRLSSTVVMAS